MALKTNCNTASQHNKTGGDFVSIRANGVNVKDKKETYMYLSSRSLLAVSSKIFGLIGKTCIFRYANIFWLACNRSWTELHTADSSFVSFPCLPFM